MREFESLLGYLGDPRLAAHATSARPAWLWSVDATRLLWANPVGAAILGAPSPAALAHAPIDPKGTAARQIARIAGTLPHGAAPRLERLRGFGGPLGGALLCSCSRIMLADRTVAILVVAIEPAGPALPLHEQAARLLAGCTQPIALFAADGSLLHATPAAYAELGRAITVSSLGIAPLASEALSRGRAAGSSPAGPVALARIGADASPVLIATFAARAPEAAPPAIPVELVPPPQAAIAPSGGEETASTEAEAPTEPRREPQPQPASAADAGEPAATVAPVAPPAPVAHGAPGAAGRRQPLRFVWQTDAEDRFTVESPEFLSHIGPRTAAALGQPWSELAASLGLDPAGEIARALKTHETFSGLTVCFPLEGEARLTVELSGLPVFDRDRNFRGYRGFGICRQAERTAATARPAATQAEPGPSAAPTPTPASGSAERPEPPVLRQEPPILSLVPPSVNVVPFRAAGPAEKAAGLTPVERKAFNELANRLTARLRSAEAPTRPEPPRSEEQASRPVPSPAAPAAAPDTVARPPAAHKQEGVEGGVDQRPILDRLPIGVLVYRLDKLIYANRAFLDWTGYRDLHELEQAGGLDALFVEPGSNIPGTDNGAKALTIATNRGDQLPVEARLFTSPWEGESALVLMLASAGGEERRKSLEAALRSAKSESAELRAILDTATDGVVLFDREGRVLSVNRSAEALFGCESRDLVGLPFAGLFAPDSQRVALDYVGRLQQGGVAAVLNDGREVTGRTRNGGLVPLFMTVGRVADGTERLCAVFRDITQWKKAEAELVAAKRQAEQASQAKSDFLARVSHEIRTPLNAIIGFAEVMMQERFGPIGNERYRQYLKDIHASGGYLVSLLNDLLDLSKIEAGRLQLEFENVDLNVVTQQCVGLMQPQASRQRIIIRTALASSLPPIVADARSVRQIVLNLLSNSIKFTGPGGQVIVSTALGDGGEVMLRVRDTGVGMSEQDLAAALEPFRQLATTAARGPEGSGLGLPLTKALAEANRASFRIKSAVNAGTLVEIAFSGARVAAE